MTKLDEKLISLQELYFITHFNQENKFTFSSHVWLNSALWKLRISDHFVIIKNLGFEGEEEG
jgi:hypothetical protein